MTKETKGDASEIENMIEKLETKKSQYNLAIDTAIASLRAIAGIGSDIPTIGQTKPSKSHALTIASDTFYGLTFIKAVIKCLKMCGTKQQTETILQNVRKGGIKITDKSGEALLRREARKKKDLVRVGRGEWGLKEFYGNDK